MNYLEYKRLKDKIDFGKEAEQTVAAAELKKASARERWQYQKMYADEIMGKDPLTSRTIAEPVRKPTEDVKPAAANKPTKASVKPIKKPAMSYEKFKKTFNKMCDDAKLLNVSNKSPIRVLSEFRNENPDLYEQYKARMEDDE